MPPTRSQQSSAISSRKSHKKSRRGCATCKRRHIKCDEKKPACSYCVKTSKSCEYGDCADQSLSAIETSPGVSTSTPTRYEITRPHASDSSPQNLSEAATSRTNLSLLQPSLYATDELQAPDTAGLPSINVADLELFHNYLNYTCYTMDKDGRMQTFYRINVPEMGFSHPLVLHSLLAVSGAHLARFRHKARDQYLSLAHAHYQEALRIGTAQLASCDASNAAAIFMFANLCSNFALGLGPQPGDYLLFSTSGQAEWIVLFRGVRAILETHNDVLMNGPLAPIFRTALRRIVRKDQELPEPEPEHLRMLRVNISKVVEPDDPHLPIYLHAIESLTRSWPSQSLGYTPQIIGSWLYRVSGDFVERLQERKPAAMIVFAYFCVLMNELSTFWWAEGWPQHILRGIYKILDDDWRMYIRWPMEQIGWIPE